MIEPPLPIPLTDQHLKMIGELCAILGQIDLFMQESAMFLLNVNPRMAAAIMGSTDVRARSDVWTRIVESKCQDQAVKQTAANAVKRLGKLSEHRNDFVHAYFATLVQTVSGS